MSAIFKTKQEQLSQNEIRRQNTQEVGVDHPAAYFLMQLIALVPSDMGFRKVWINPGEPRIDDKKIADAFSDEQKTRNYIYNKTVFVFVGRWNRLRINNTNKDKELHKMIRIFLARKNSKNFQQLTETPRWLEVKKNVNVNEM